MLKKAKAGVGQNQSASTKRLSKAVLESSHQIWLAGLGAFAKAQEGGRQVFDTLVKHGEVLESKTRQAAAKTAEAARDVATTKTREMQAVAGGTWDKLEQVFEDRVSRSLARLGVYTSSDVQKLTERVNELSEALNALLKAQGIKHTPRTAPMEGPVKTAARRAPRAAPDATSGPPPTATRTAKRTARTATKSARVAMK